MRAVDTNVVVRLLVRDDPGQVASAEVFIEQGAWVSLLALAEATWVLGSGYGLSASAIISAVEMLVAHQSLTVQEPDVVLLALDLLRAKPSLGFANCLMLELARKAGHLPLGTFDRSLAKVDGAEKLPE
jgi:predicted nucleic-acid-binding protein